jgi:selenide, water dikinase
MKIVLLGGGHSHALVLKKMGMNIPRNLELTLVSPLSMTPYSGMVPGFLSGQYTFGECHIDLRHLCNFAGARFIQDSAIGIDASSKLVHLKGSPSISYDFLSIDIGSSPSTAILGDRDVVTGIKPIHLFLDRLDSFTEYLPKIREHAKIGIVGGGAGGIEVAFSLREKFKHVEKQPEIHIFHNSNDIMESTSPKDRGKVRKALGEKSIALHCNERVTRAQKLRDSIHKIQMSCDSGFSMEVNLLIFTTSAASPKWILDSSLAKDEKGFITVNSSLQSISNKDIFASGDIASIDGERLEKSGVYAVRQAPILYENIIRSSQNKKLLKYKPQRHFLSLLSIGDGRAIAKKKGFVSNPSKWIWHWKDSIDRNFMKKFQNLPPMKNMNPMPEKKEDVFKCMGCGSKLGSNVLQRSLDRIKNSKFLESEEQEPLSERISKIVKNQMKIHSSSRIIIGNDKRDDSAVLSIPPGKHVVQSIDFFKPIVRDSFIAAKITTHHCLNDLYALGATPDSAMALVTLPELDENDAEEELVRILTGVTSVLQKEDCKLIGGHTNEGKEFSIGLSCMGLVEAGNELNKDYCREGDKLILTKPLGTGLVFAMDMRNLSKSSWVESAIDSMLQSNALALEIMKENRVRAITDISGFGLAGHLLNVLRASQKSANVYLDTIPLLEGIEEILKNHSEIKSSMFPSNWKSYENFVKRDESFSENDLSMLFDPQTSGGLLGVVPEELATRCLVELKQKGYKASMIGEISFPSVEIRIRRQNK